TRAEVFGEQSKYHESSLNCAHGTSVNVAYWLPFQIWQKLLNIFAERNLPVTHDSYVLQILFSSPAFVAHECKRIIPIGYPAVRLSTSD
ncbi:MAG: hypothetical protein EAY75_17655, partial [Bacteroidetes bacterium]